MGDDSLFELTAPSDGTLIACLKTDLIRHSRYLELELADVRFGPGPSRDTWPHIAGRLPVVGGRRYLLRVVWAGPHYRPEPITFALTTGLEPSSLCVAQSSVTLTGVVFEYTAAGRLPRPGVPLLIRRWPQGADHFLEVTSGGDGRYIASGIAAAAGISIAPAVGAGYYAPCPNGSSGAVRFDSTFDVHVVSEAVLSSVGAPAELPRLEGVAVSGVVFENTPQGLQPIAGASVTLNGDGQDARIGSTTLTNAQGYYFVCPEIPGTGGDTDGSLHVRRVGYRPATARPTLYWHYLGFDVELVRE